MANDFNINNGDIDINNGDFAVKDSENMNIEHILSSNKGYWFEYPLLGIDIINEVNSSGRRQQLKQDVRRQLVYDNFSVRKVDITLENEVIIDAKRR